MEDFDFSRHEVEIAPGTTLSEVYRIYRGMYEEQPNIWDECKAFKHWLEVYQDMLPSRERIFFTVLYKED